MLGLLSRASLWVGNRGKSCGLASIACRQWHPKPSSLTATLHGQAVEVTGWRGERALTACGCTSSVSWGDDTQKIISSLFLSHRLSISDRASRHFFRIKSSRGSRNDSVHTCRRLSLGTPKPRGLARSFTGEQSLQNWRALLSPYFLFSLFLLLPRCGCLLCLHLPSLSLWSALWWKSALCPYCWNLRN